MMKDWRYGDSRGYGADNRRHWGNSNFRSPTPPRRPLPPSGRFRNRGGDSPLRTPRRRYHGDVEEERRGGEGGSLRSPPRRPYRGDVEEERRGGGGGSLRSPPRRRYLGDVEEERSGGEGSSLRGDYDSRNGDRWSRDNDSLRGGRDHDYRSSSYGDEWNNRGYDGNFNWGDRAYEEKNWELDRTFDGGDTRDRGRAHRSFSGGDRGRGRGFDCSFSGGDRGNGRGYDQNFSSGRHNDGNSSRGGDRISSNVFVDRARHYGGRERNLDEGQSERVYQSGGDGELSWRTHGGSERASSKYQSDDLLDETKNGFDSSFRHEVGSNRLGSSDLNYDYRSAKLFDKPHDGLIAEANPILVDSERKRNYVSSSYPVKASFPTRIHSHVDTTGSALRYSSDHHEKDDGIHFPDEFTVGKLVTPGIVRRDPLATESYEDKLPYSGTAIDYTVSSSRLKGFDPVAPGSFKDDISTSIRDDHSLSSDSNRLRTGVPTNAFSYDCVGEKLGARSPVNHGGRYGDFKSYSQSYLGNSEENHKDYNYPHGDSSVAGKVPSFTEIYRKSLLVGEEKPNVSSHEGYLRGNRLLDHHSTSRGLSISDHDDVSRSYNTRRKDIEDQPYKDLEQPNFGRELYRGSGSSKVGEPNYVDEVGLSPRFHHAQSDISLSRENDHVGDVDGNSNDEFMRNTSFSKPGSLLKRRHGGSEFDDPRDMNYAPVDTGELWSNDGDSGIPSGRLRIRNPSVSGTISITSSSRLRRASMSGARDIKKRLGPAAQKLHVSQRLVKRGTHSLKKRLGPAPKKNHHTLPWLKNLNAPILPRIDEDSGGSPGPQEEHSVEDKDTPVKPEPPENSEEFKQRVKIAFFKFVKQLNETPAKRRKYMEQRTGFNLKCIICQSLEEFVSTESLATHALTCQKIGLRSQHLGFHKALCVLMGWKFGASSDSAWSCEKLSAEENKALKEDLILWPPVVIIHNNTIGIRNTDQQVIVTVEELEAKLRDMGFGDRAKVYRGKPANQSVMAVEFAATLSGLQEAERLHKFFAEKKHGRVEFLEFKSSSNLTSVMEAESELVNKLDSILYGYLGIAQDLDNLDFDAKKHRLVKSKKEIAKIAEAPIKT